MPFEPRASFLPANVDLTGPGVLEFLFIADQDVFAQLLEPCHSWSNIADIRGTSWCGAETCLAFPEHFLHVLLPLGPLRD